MSKRLKPLGMNVKRWNLITFADLVVEHGRLVGIGCQWFDTSLRNERLDCKSNLLNCFSKKLWMWAYRCRVK